MLSGQTARSRVLESRRAVLTRSQQQEPDPIKMNAVHKYENGVCLYLKIISTIICPLQKKKKKKRLEIKVTKPP
jgi:hypothetical protein